MVLVADRAMESPSYASQTLTFEWIRGDRAIIEALASEWGELCGRSGDEQPFFRPALALAFVDAFMPNAAVVLVTARRDGQLVAVLPMVERVFGVGRFGVRWLHSTSNTHFPRFDVVHADIDADVLAHQLWRFLSSQPDWDVIQIDSAPGGGVADRMRFAAAREGARSALHDAKSTPYLAIDPNEHHTFEAILKGRSKSLRSGLRRAARKLDELGTVALVCLGPQDSRESLLEGVRYFYELEHSSWKGQAGTSILSDPSTQAFYDRLVDHAIERGELLTYRLEVDGDPVAIDLGMIAGSTYMGLKIAHDDAYKHCSPGHMLNLHILRDLACRGFRELDMGGKAEPYKLAWTDTARPFGNVFLFHPGMRGDVLWRLMFRLGPEMRRRWGDRRVPQLIRNLLA